MASEDAEQSADPPAPEEQKENKVEEKKVEEVEVSEEEKVEKEKVPESSEAEKEEATESSEVVDEQKQHEEVEGQTEEQNEGQEGEGAVAEAGEEAEGEGSRKLTIDDIKTAPMDFRFPTTNQARHCFTRYIEYHKCVQVKGEDNPDCNKYARYYRSLCPGEWIDKWNEERENGTFPGPL